MRVDVDCAFDMHKVTKRKDKEGDIGASASFIDVTSSNMRVIVNVVGYEKRGLKYTGDVSEWSGFGLGFWIKPLLDLVEKDLRRISVGGPLYLFGRDLFAPGR